VALDGGAGIDDVQFLFVGGDREVVAADNRDHRKLRTRRLPALGAATGVVVRHVALDGDGDRIGGAVAGERAALEFLGAGFETLVDRWMQLDGHDHSLVVVCV
jgi:hypothetical protein